MSDMFSEDNLRPKAKAGIKNFLFTSSGTNGQSHRRNREKKSRQHKKNMGIRSALYSKMQGEKGSIGADLLEWHQTLHALSNGTA